MALGQFPSGPQPSQGMLGSGRFGVHDSLGGRPLEERVSTIPGITWLTRIPAGAHSTASTLVRPPIPAFEVV